MRFFFEAMFIVAAFETLFALAVTFISIPGEAGERISNFMTKADLDHGWVPADGNMKQVAEKLETTYGMTGVNAWFGHPVRLTVKRK